MLVAMKRGLGHIQGYRSAEKHLMLICISLNNKIYMVLKRQTKMQTSYRSALNTTGSPTTTHAQDRKLHSPMLNAVRVYQCYSSCMCL